MSKNARTDHLRIWGQDIRFDVRAARPGPGRDGSGRDGSGSDGAGRATAGPAVPLLMCGGIGASLEVLQPLVDSMDPGIEVIRFDVPGIGGSPASLLPYAFPQLVPFVGRMLDELGYGQVDVLGYSWGGALAQQLAFQGGNRYRRMVLISTSAGILAIPGDPRVMSEMLTPRSFHDAREATTVAGRLQHPGGAPHTAGVRPRLSDVVSSGSVLGYLHQLAAIGTWTSLPFLPFIGQSVLVINGDDDPIVPVVNAQILVGLIPRSSQYIFSGDHLGIVTAAAELGERSSQFLRA